MLRLADAAWEHGRCDDVVRYCEIAARVRAAELRYEEDLLDCLATGLATRAVPAGPGRVDGPLRQDGGWDDRANLPQRDARPVVPTEVG